MEWTQDGKTKTTTFRRVLLTKCQQEFEKDKKDDEERESMLAAIEKAETVREEIVEWRGRGEGGEREREGLREKRGERGGEGG